MRIYMNKRLEKQQQFIYSLWTSMAPKSVLIILTELLITKVISYYTQPYSSVPYAIRDPRSPIPYQDYRSLYAHYASQVPYNKPAHPRPATAVAQAPRPVEYRQPSYQRPGEISPPTAQPVKFQPYPAQTVPEHRLPSYQKSAAVSPTILIQRPVAKALPYQRPTEYVAPDIQRVEYQQPHQQVAEYINPPVRLIEIPSTYQAAEALIPIDQSAKQIQSLSYQKMPELILPRIQNPTEFFQPAYQKIANFVEKNPLEIPQPVCYKTDSSPIFTSPEIPQLASSVLESLQSSALSKSDCLIPKSNSDTLDSNVLNNLAIALQLLIVNNIINHPRSDAINSMSNEFDSLLEVQPPCAMHNAKFLGSSNFVDDTLMSKGMLGLGSFGAGLPLSRPGFNLMSPYDAIAASPSSLSPFSDSPSLIALKNNFQSPYAAIIATDNNKDLFSMSDLF